MGNTASTATNSAIRLAQAHQTIASLQATVDAQKTKDTQTLPKFQVYGAQFVERLRRLETPRPILLTSTFMVREGRQILTTPFQLMTEASTRGVSLVSDMWSRGSTDHFVLYRGLTETAAPGTQLRGQPVDYTFVMKLQGTRRAGDDAGLVPVNLSNADIEWLQTQTGSTPTSLSRAPSAQPHHTQTRETQSIPGKEERPLDTAARMYAHIPATMVQGPYGMSQQPQIGYAPKSTHLSGFREPSRYLPEDIHFQQIARR